MRDRAVGWCLVELTTTNFLLPRSEFEQLSAKLTNRQSGWHETEDVFGRSIAFRLRDVAWLADCSPASIDALIAAEAEDSKGTV